MPSYQQAPDPPQPPTNALLSRTLSHHPSGCVLSIRPGVSQSFHALLLGNQAHLLIGIPSAALAMDKGWVDENGRHACRRCVRAFRRRIAAADELTPARPPIYRRRAPTCYFICSIQHGSLFSSCPPLYAVLPVTTHAWARCTPSSDPPSLFIRSTPDSHIVHQQFTSTASKCNYGLL